MQHPNGREGLNAELIAAVRVNNLQKIDSALARGANIDATHNRVHGHTALYMACNDNAWDAAQHLIKMGADVTRQDFQGRNIIDNVLLSIDAGYEGAAHTLIALIDKSIENNTPFKNIQTAFYIALRRNNLVLADQLLARGADVNARDENGYTALMHLSETYGDMESRIDYLLGKGADMLLKNNDGMTALQLALAWAEDRWESSDNEDADRVVEQLNRQEKKIKQMQVVKTGSAAAAPTKRALDTNRHGKPSFKGPRPK